MPKLKTHSGAKKRFNLTKSGKVKRAHAFMILIQQDLIIFFRKLSCRLAGHIGFSFLFQKDVQGKMFHI